MTGQNLRARCACERYPTTSRDIFREDTLPSGPIAEAQSDARCNKQYRTRSRRFPHRSCSFYNCLLLTANILPTSVSDLPVFSFDRDGHMRFGLISSTRGRWVVRMNVGILCLEPPTT
jgi:hypothetical protein